MRLAKLEETTDNCERSELSGVFNGTDFLSVSGHTSCRKCSKCFYVYLNIRPMRYSTVNINVQHTNVTGSMNWHNKTECSWSFLLLLNTVGGVLWVGETQAGCLV